MKKLIWMFFNWLALDDRDCETESDIFYKITNLIEKIYDPKLKNIVDVERELSNYLDEFRKYMN